MTVSRWILLRIRTASHRNCRQIQNTHFPFNTGFQKIVPFMIITWKNMVEPDRTQITIKYGACILHAG